jgi:acyl carrier protein
MALDQTSLVDWLVTHGGVNAAELERDTPLFSGGRLDSLLLLELIAFIEKSCGIRVSWNEVTLDNLDSVARILDFADRSAG